MPYQLLITALVALAAIVLIRFEESGKVSLQQRQHTERSAQRSRLSGNCFGVAGVDATYDYVYFTRVS